MTAAPRTSSRIFPYVGAWAAIVLCALGVSRLEPRLADTIHANKDTTDIYAFPPPAILRLATLGYTAAATDVLWGKLLVDYGTHWSEHRPFADLEKYLEAINSLDPKYRPLYEYVDSLLCYRPVRGYEPDARLTRAYLERAIHEFPNDPDMWLHYGQFIAFMGPTYLASEADQLTWRREGGVAMEHAVELGADVHFGIAAGAMMNSRYGEREATIKFLERAYALTDDEAERQEIAARLKLLQANDTIDRAQTVVQDIESRWLSTYPFLDRGTFMLLGPITPTLKCVGAAAATEAACATDWDHAVPP